MAAGYWEGRKKVIFDASEVIKVDNFWAALFAEEGNTTTTTTATTATSS
jgi:hypothetical protein